MALTTPPYAVVNTQNKPAEASLKAKPAADRDVARLEEELADKLGAVVAIKANKKGAGSLTIEFASLDQLDGLIGKLQAKKSSRETGHEELDCCCVDAGSGGECLGGLG